MKIAFEVDTESPGWPQDKNMILRIFRDWTRILEKAEASSKSREAEAALKTVKEIMDKPVDKPETPEPEPQSKPKREWNEKQKKDIQAIKDAVKKQKVSNKRNNFRDDIDDSLIIYMRDKSGMSLKQIAKELGCCEQTVLNRYNRAKKEMT